MGAKATLNKFPVSQATFLSCKSRKVGSITFCGYLNGSYNQMTSSYLWGHSRVSGIFLLAIPGLFPKKRVERCFGHSH